jgi:hypothetical protein
MRLHFFDDHDLLFYADNRTRVRHGHLYINSPSAKIYFRSTRSQILALTCLYAVRLGLVDAI